MTDLPQKLSLNALRVLLVMLAAPETARYALELTVTCEIGVGSIYATLGGLEDQGLVTSRMEEIDPVTKGRPTRRYYRKGSGRKVHSFKGGMKSPAARRAGC